MRSFLLLTALLTFSTGAVAQSRYEVVGDTLNFDMLVAEPGYAFTRQLEAYDINLLWEYIFKFTEIRKLKITGPGGDMDAARKIAEVLITHNIDTVAYGKCYSACTLIFLGGQSRTLEADAELGFHRQWVNPTMHKKNFDALQDVMEWKNEFEYLTYIYNKLNSKLVGDIQYMDDRGVAFNFIMRTISTEVFDMWTPSREVLLAAGVLTE